MVLDGDQVGDCDRPAKQQPDITTPQAVGEIGPDRVLALRLRVLVSDEIQQPPEDVPAVDVDCPLFRFDDEAVAERDMAPTLSTRNMIVTLTIEGNHPSAVA